MNSEQFEKINQIYNKQKENLFNGLERPFDSNAMGLYLQHFKNLTSEYINKLLNLQGIIDGHAGITESLTVSIDEVKALRYEIFNQISKVKQSKLMAEECIYHELITNQIKDLTSKEKEILKFMYLEKLEYKEIYTNKLHIAKRTFDAHLNRIANKLYSYIENEKDLYPRYAHMFPIYPTKEDTDIVNRKRNAHNITTYANPYSVISDFLTLF